MVHGFVVSSVVSRAVVVVVVVVCVSVFVRVACVCQFENALVTSVFIIIPGDKVLSETKIKDSWCTGFRWKEEGCKLMCEDEEREREREREREWVVWSC